MLLNLLVRLKIKASGLNTWLALLTVLLNFLVRLTRLVIYTSGCHPSAVMLNSSVRLTAY